MKAEEYLRQHPFFLGETEDGEDYLSPEDLELIKQLAPMLEEFTAIRLADEKKAFVALETVLAKTEQALLIAKEAIQALLIEKETIRSWTKENN